MPNHHPSLPSSSNGSSKIRGPRRLPRVPTGEAPFKSPAYDLDLYALWRQDNSIVSTVARFDRVTSYHQKEGFEGRMVIYERAIYPVYGFCILNDRGVIVHIQHLYPEDDISVHGNAVKIKSYPDFTDRRLSLACSSSAEVVYKFSDIYNIPNLDSLDERSKGVSKVVGLSASAEDIKVLMGLHAYIRINKPYPKERMSASNRFQRILPTIHIPPSPSTSYSPSPSPFFSPFLHPVLDTPPTSAAPSPCSSPPATFSFQSPHPIQGSRDYRRIALLNQNPSYSAPDGLSLPTSRVLLLNSTSERASTERPLAGIGGPMRHLNSNFAASCLQVRGNRNQRLPSSKLANTSGTVVSSEVVASRDDLSPGPELRGVVKKIGQYPLAGGGFSDVFLGEITGDNTTIRSEPPVQVAIKVLRLSGSYDSEPQAIEKLNTRLDRERKIWTPLRHPNVLPFLGVSRDFGPFPALISPYCSSRDVVSFLKRHRHVDRRPIVIGLTDGLRYLHSRQVIHGDLKGSNVLIGPNGEALICDLGASKIIGCRGFTTGLVGTTPFMAPELFPDFDVVIDEDAVDNDDSPSNPQLTKETDCYAYGLVLLQILTGKDPKPHYFGTPKAQLLPKRQYYGSMSDQLWDLVESCCRLDPKKRPTMDEVTQRIPSIVGSTPYPAVDGATSLASS